MKALALVTTGLALALIAPAQAQEPNFGRAVAVSGQDLLVGQPVNWYGPGTVYTYRLGPDATWTERSLLTAPDSSRMDDFGRTLALDDNTLVVGAPRKRDGAGVAYAFERTSTDAPWEPAGVIAPPADMDHREFATALAISGNDLLVSSPAVGSTGVVYHYVRRAGAWSLQGEISPPASEGVAGFGRALSWQGDHVLIGAPAADSARGRVYVVERTTDGVWGMPRAIDLPALDEAEAEAGAAVLLVGDHAFVGAPGGSAVFVLEFGAAGEWTVTETLRPDDDPRGLDFGFSLAATEDELWVGAPGAERNNGRVYRFVTDEAGGRRSAPPLEPEETEADSWPLRFGYALAATDGHAVVAMPTRDFGEGRALALARSSGGWGSEQLLEGRIFRIGGELTSGDRCEGDRMTEFSCTNIELLVHENSVIR